MPLTDIVEFTSEAKNPGNDKNVAIVDIELPSMQKYPGLRLVDTPGLGSVYDPPVRVRRMASFCWHSNLGRKFRPPSFRNMI